MRPEIHHRDARADVLDHRQIVRDEQVGEAEFLLQVFQQVDDLRLDRDVERGDRLVADDQLRRHRQRPGDADALALAAGELVRVAPHVVGAEADGLEQFDDALLELAPGLREPVDDQRLADDRADRHARIERGVGVLEDDLHVARQRPQLGRRLSASDVAALEPDLARSRLDQAQDAAAGRRLAAARLADQAQRLAGSNLEADPVDRMHLLDAARQNSRA